MYVNSPNVAAVRSAIEQGAVSGEFLPTVYVVELTSICNLACVMCPNPRMPHSDLGHIDLGLFKKIIDDISPYAEFLMLYWMGEPTLHPRFKDAIKYARSRIKGKIVVSTNMTVGDKGTLQALRDHADIILCSLDRDKKASFEKIRRGASYAEVRHNIKKLLATEPSSDSQGEVVVKALDLDHSGVEFKEYEATWSKEGARVLLAWLNDWAGTFPGMRNAASMEIPRAAAYRVPCADLWFKMVINWKGQVSLCCFDWQYNQGIGHVADTEGWLGSVWHSRNMIGHRKAHIERRYKDISICEKCTTWGEPAELDAYVDWSEDSYFIVF